LQRLRDNPRPLILAAIAVAAIAVFFVVVAPLFSFGGAPMAEIAGSIPSSARSDVALEIDVGLDNVGTSIIDPVCLEASITGPLAADHALFQGLDNVPFRAGRACGGSLNGQETISVRVFLRPTGEGRATLSLVPTRDATAVGSALSGTVDIGGT
jgi:hypothetical protein